MGWGNEIGRNTVIPEVDARFSDHRLDWNNAGSVVIDGVDDEKMETEDRYASQGSRHAPPRWPRDREAVRFGHLRSMPEAFRFAVAQWVMP